ncbi:rac guanine nucleotide exchange factor JJ-like [Hylaeus anthracinus]|uniref:rac guanine nucleotide exchange factor JJ-like n=1 Tax=Hylaeus volcanicus TaxID=313075 RepID=UPI0023B7835B|nr:rac guanine nucleotide exchange factor JJ-like [Hylaeus volcanicus]XP_053997344.1 rac guanine nucleotide exchange factor JJ-like [Hylaeus anthracinus]
MMNSPMSPQTPLSFELRTIINNRNVLSMRSRMKVLNSLNESNQRCFEEKEKNLRCQAIQEILTTEVTYLRQLEILMEYFIEPMFKKKLLDHILLSTLSENIKTLYNVSGELVKELKEDPENIAGAFHKLAPFFKLYSVYAYDYEQVLSLIQTKQESNFIFKDFISKQESRPEVSRKLPSLLITPIQRVPRYRLLLQEVLQHTPHKHKEYNLLQVCLVEVEKAARHINTLVEQHEEVQKLLKLQKCIVNPINLVKPGRRFIKQGALMRVSRRGNSAYRRYFVLLSDTLLYCKGDPENSLTLCCVLPLNKCKVECVLSGGLFRVSCLNETLLLYSEKDDSNLWMEAIENSIKKYAECRQTLRKDSSSRKPLRHNNLNLFPSENIPVVAGKRKRPDGETEVNLDASRIMYLKKDNEADADIQSDSNCFILLKRFKKFKNNNISEYSNSCIQNFDYNSTGKENEHCTENIALRLSPVSSSTYDQQTSSTFKSIGEFFSSIGSSLKEFFKFR